MTRKFLVGIALAFLLLLTGVGVFRSQEAPEPPRPPELPAFPEALFGEGQAWLGVRLSEVTAEKARELKLPGEYGAVVVGVEENSPAAKAGVAKNEVILEFAGERVRSVTQLQRLVRETPPGRAFTLAISRAGQTRTLNLKLEGREPHEFEFFLRGVPMPDFHGPAFDFAFGQRASLGVSAEELTRQLADYFGVKQGKGVLVREVVVGSAAEKGGIKAGDVIVRIDGTEVGSPTELRRALPRDVEEKRKVAVTVVRDRREQTLSVELKPSGHHSLRRAERIEIMDLDPGALTDLAKELESHVVELGAEAQQEARKAQGEALKEQERWQKEWLRNWQLKQRELKDEINRELRTRELAAGRGVV